MIFVTVGSQMPFERLIRGVDECMERLSAIGEVFGQIGQCRYRPRNFAFTDFLENAAFTEYMKKCSAIVSHAGMGNICLAMQLNKPLIVMPRLRQYREVVNNHQLDIVKQLEKTGQVLAAYDTRQLEEQMRKLDSFHPASRCDDSQAICEKITIYLETLSHEKNRKRPNT